MQGPTPLPPPSIPFDFNWLAHSLPDLIALIVSLSVLALGVRWFLRSPIAEALAEGIRLRRRRRYGGEFGDTEDPRISAAEQQIRVLETHVSELSERLDFAERLLAERRQPKLGAGQ
jgi:hypothetical protein